MSKVTTTYSIQKICSDGKNGNRPCLYLYWESLLFIKEQGIMYCHLLLTFTPQQFLKVFNIFYIVGIQVVNEDLLTHEATPSCKDICTPDSLLCHVSSFTFLQISYYHVMKQSFTIGCSPLYSHKSISTRIGRPCLFHASHPNPSVLFVLNWVCQLQSA